jgi:RNA polymerase sigma factor (sigma-70 family)
VSLVAASDDLDRAAVRASCDEPRAFSSVFERHFDDVRRYLVRRVGSALGDELASETFVQAFDGRVRFDADRGVVRAWLFGIAANLLRHRARSEERRLRAYARSGVDPVAEELEGVPARVDAQRTGPRLAAALARLSSGEREVVLLYAWAGLSYDEIAVALELPVGTIRSRLSRARARLRHELACGDETCEDARAPLAFDGRGG